MRASLHRGAKASRRGLCTLHGDDQRLLAAGLVDRIDVAALQEHSILHFNGGQLASSHAEEGISGMFGQSVAKGPARRILLSRGYGGLGRKQILLPGAWAEVIAEERLIVPPL